MLIEILFKMLFFKGGVLIYAEHCISVSVQVNLILSKLERCGNVHLFQ